MAIGLSMAFPSNALAWTITPITWLHSAYGLTTAMAGLIFLGILIKRLVDLGLEARAGQGGFPWRNIGREICWYGFPLALFVYLGWPRWMAWAQG